MKKICLTVAMVAFAFGIFNGLNTNISKENYKQEVSTGYMSQPGVGW